MQPFDALTMRAVLQEAKPLLLNRRVEKVYQLGRDEVILAMRLKTGSGYFLVSAQASFGRLCLVPNPDLPKQVNPPGFCQVLRRYLAGATIVAVDQLIGERVANITFACTDELGTRSIKVLTAEIMGRHSNLIFWDKEKEKIIAASHVVTQEMSRQREVAAGLKYVRPPQQDKPNIFAIDKAQFDAAFSHFQEALQSSASAGQPASWEQWLVAAFGGTGRHLAEELIAAAGITECYSDEASAALWEKIAAAQTCAVYQAAMRKDLTRYTVLGWWPELSADNAGEDWQKFPAVNDMVEAYFHTLHEREQLHQLKERIRAELKSEGDKVETKLKAAAQQLATAQDFQQFKVWGDLILANLANIQTGQSELVCDDLYATGGNGTIKIVLNPQLGAAQNAQYYYRQFAKARVRKQAAGASVGDANARLAVIKKHLDELEGAQGSAELSRLKEVVLDRGKRAEQNFAQAIKQSPVQPKGTGPNKGPRLMSTRSSEGWLIYIGRNRMENDVLLSKLGQPHDFWLHVLGQEGAHVLIKNPNKQDPPSTTLREAAQLAARFSRISLGSKVRVVYTQCRYVRKATGKEKQGLVHYENEKTLEVDTAAPMPSSLRKLFAK